MRTHVLAALVALTALPASLPATAGVVIRMESKPSPQAAAEPVTLSVMPDRVRAETAQGTFIFRGDKQLAWLLQPREKTYHELTAAQAEQVAGMMAQVQQQLASMPPEQRAMVEQMMKGRGMGAPGAAAERPAPTVVPTGTTETINGWATTSYEVRRDGRAEQELRVAEYAAVGLKPEDVAVFQQMAEFTKKLAGPMAQQVEQQPFAQASQVPGVPVRTTVYSPGGPAVHELKAVERQDVPASQFEVPAGYTKQSLGP